tara:strand:+ start:489 stop:2900 length:2412 start_codon:yes stop_codon:yes gene_type:complete
MAKKEVKANAATDYFKAEKLRTREERFISQCYLLSNLDRFIGVTPYGRTNLIPVQGDPSTFLGKALSRSKMERFLEQVSPAELSALVPKIRIFKVEKNNITNGFREVELHFDDYTSEQDLAAITKTRFGRGSGVGMKSCYISYDGTNPAESTRMVNVRLNMFFAKIEDMLRGQAGSISFIDLIRPKKETKDPSKLTQNEHQIRLEVGWAIPPSGHALFQGQKELREAIADSTLSLFLTLREHQLSFEQDGRVNMAIDFIGRIEATTNSSNFNIFPDPSGGDVTQSRSLRIKYKEQKAADAKRTLQYNECLKAKKGKRGPSEAKIKKLRSSYLKSVQQLKSAKEQDKIVKYESILRTLFDMGKINVTSISKDFLGISNDITKRIKYKTYGKLPYTDPGKSGCKTTPRVASPSESLRYRNILSAAKGGVKQFQKNVSKKLRLLGSSRDSKCVDIYYMFLGDLMDVAMNRFYDTADSETFKPENAYFKFLLGSIVRRDDPSRQVNLADIPISLDYFVVWFANTIIRRNLDTYGLNDFMFDIVSKLVSPIMNLKCLRNVKQTESRINPRFIQFYMPAEGDSRNQKDPLLGVTNGQFLKTAGNYKPGKKKLPVFSHIDVEGFPSMKKGALKKAKTGNVYSYIYITGHEEVSNYRKVNYLRDIREGIYHFNLGTDSGLIKTINFEQISIPGQAEAIAEGTSLSWVRRLYNAKVSLYGNSFFVPGMKVYINPLTIGLGRADKGESVASQLGLGGYYIIIKVEHSIESGKFQTDLTCKWESKGNGFGIKTVVEQKPDSKDCSRFLQKGKTR